MATSRRKKIALVEDSPDSAEVFTHFLDHFCDQFEVRSFSDGPKFLETFRRGMYRVVILDVSLPGIDGYEVLRRVRMIDSNVPVIAFTAHARFNSREHAIQAGFNDVATKPVQDLDAFCKRVINFAETATN
jgi:CheY-like chemotaxis protein